MGYPTDLRMYPLWNLDGRGKAVPREDGNQDNMKRMNKGL